LLDLVLLRHLLVVLLAALRLLGRPDGLERALDEPVRELEEERRSVLAVRLVERDEVGDERPNDDAGRVVQRGDRLQKGSERSRVSTRTRTQKGSAR